jgi:hypothetical protein
VIVAARRPTGAGTVPVLLVSPGTPYGADRAWLIRPDGYVAASAPLMDPAGLAELVGRVV